MRNMAGWLGAEYFPSGRTEESLYWLADWRAAMSASRLDETLVPGGRRLTEL